MIESQTPQVSICIVPINARQVLADCLRSLAEHTSLPYEIIVVDNGSTDGTAEMLAVDFPEVRYVGNPDNIGYTRANNIAMRMARGKHIVLLNADTLVLDAAIDRLTAYLEDHPDVGVCGPKVLNRDGSLQLPCRRGEPRPWAVISYFSGLAQRFPKDRRFSGYLLTHLDEDEINPVDGVSGSCMLIRGEVYRQIGGLDERFFAYQEDADYCARARAAGWQVVYMPKARIVHFGGLGGSRAQPYRGVWEWHRSYFLYYRKHLARDYFFAFNWVYYGLMGLKLLFSLMMTFIRREKYVGPKRG